MKILRRVSRPLTPELGYVKFHVLVHAALVPSCACSAANSCRGELMKTLRLRGFNPSQSSIKWYCGGWTYENVGAMRMHTCKLPLEELLGSSKVPLL